MTDRDVYLLKVLRHGPLAFIPIFAQLQVLNKGEHGNGFDDKVELGIKQKVRTLKKGDKPLFSKSAVRHCLSRLVRENYIKTQTFGDRGGNGVQALYTLPEKGADELYAHGVNPETIRVVKIPARDLIPHELMVTDTIKFAHLDAKKLGFKIDVLDHKDLKGRNN